VWPSHFKLSSCEYSNSTKQHSHLRRLPQPKASDGNKPIINISTDIYFNFPSSSLVGSAVSSPFLMPLIQ
jgi:hypothetical protein